MPYQFGDVTRHILGMSRHEDPDPLCSEEKATIWELLKFDISDQLRRIRDTLACTFDPDRPEHLELLSLIWNVKPVAGEMSLSHDNWKVLGFQGLNPMSDIRAGGLLSVVNLAHLANIHPDAYAKMLDEIMHREAEEGVMGFYPLCTTSINVTKRICDLLCVSEDQKGAKTPEQLATMLESCVRKEQPESNLWLMVTDDKSIRVIHALVLTDFHVTFMCDKKTYLQCGDVLDAALSKLVKLSAHAGSLEALRRSYCEDERIRCYLSEQRSVAEVGGRSRWEREKAFAMQRTCTKLVAKGEHGVEEALQMDIDRVKHHMGQ